MWEDLGVEAAEKVALVPDNWEMPDRPKSCIGLAKDTPGTRPCKGFALHIRLAWLSQLMRDEEDVQRNPVGVVADEKFHHRLGLGWSCGRHWWRMFNWRNVAACAPRTVTRPNVKYEKNVEWVYAISEAGAAYLAGKG